MSTFEQLNLHASISKAIEACGYTTPTVIQARSIPEVLLGKDLVASAQTGTGKTAAFVLPALHRLCSVKGESKPRILILTPTRELATQITEAVSQYGKFMKFNLVSLVGGMPYRQQLRGLSRPVDIIVATPGRLMDHMESGRLDLSKIEMLVLDEADRMLDMGFIDDVKYIAKRTPDTRQTLLFSATFDKRISDVVKQVLKNPVRIDLSSQETMTPTKIKQELYMADNPHHKSRLLNHFLVNANIFKAIIFSATKINADRLAAELRDIGLDAAALHGDLKQSMRTKTLEQLRSGKIQFLVATDVAARGIDVSDITHVINYDLPRFSEDYVHRIGRTGRAGKEGVAISLALRSDNRHIKNIEHYIGQKLPLCTIEGLEPSKQAYAAPDKSKKKSGGFGKGRGGSSDRPRYRDDSRSSDKPRFSKDRDDSRGEKPRFSKERSSSGSDKPRFSKDRDDSRSEKPRFSKERSSFGSDKPRFSKDRDDSRSEKPRFSKERSSFGSDKPRFSKDRDDSRSEKPRFSKERSSFGSDKPRFSKDRDDSRSEKPRFSKERSSFGSDKPRFSKDRDDSRGEKPRFNKERSSFGSDKPRFSKDRDDSRSEKPRFSKDRDDSRSEKPRFSKERSSFGSDKPRFSKDRDDSRSEKPRFSKERSSFGSDKPRFSKDRDDSRSDKPRFSKERSSFGSDKPRFSKDRDDSRGEKPRFSKERSSFGSDKPRFSKDRSDSRSDKPRFGADRGNSSGDKPRYRDRDDSRSEKPRFNKDRGDSRSTKPRFGKDKGAARSSKPSFGKGKNEFAGGTLKFKDKSKKEFLD